MPERSVTRSHSGAFRVSRRTPPRPTQNGRTVSSRDSIVPHHPHASEPTCEVLSHAPGFAATS